MATSAPGLDDRTLSRMAAAGVRVSPEQWAALPAAARRRLAEHPDGDAVSRRTLGQLARWLITTFPPGWNGAAL